MLSLIPAATARAEFVESSLSFGGDLATLIPRDLDGDGRAELIVVTTESEPEGVGWRKLSVWELDPSAEAGGALHYSSIATHDVPDDAIAFTIGNFLGGGRSQLVYLAATSVNAIDETTGKPTPLLADASFIFTMPERGELAFWDCATDIDGDGRDDLILAEPDGYAIYLQNERHELISAGRVRVDASFGLEGSNSAYVHRTDPADGARTKRGSSRRSRGGAGWGYERGAGPIRSLRSLARLGLADANNDGRLDLLSMDDGRVQVYLQREQGGFGEEPDANYVLLKEKSVYNWDESGQPVTHGDVNGDGRVDFATSEINPRELTTLIRLHLWGDSGIARQPTQLIKLSGLGNAPELIDVNGDGRLDLVALTLRTDKLLSLRRRSVEELQVACHVYLFDESKGTFSTRPDLRKELELALDADLEQDQSQDFLRMDGDFNADGLNDLLVYENRGELLLFETTARRGDRMKLKFPGKPSLRHPIETPKAMRVVDLDGDSRSDVLLLGGQSLKILRSR